MIEAYISHGQIIHHYTPVQKEGFPPGFKCWCGTLLEFNYHEPGMSKRRKAFLDEHDECEYREEVKSES